MTEKETKGAIELSRRVLKEAYDRALSLSLDRVVEDYTRELGRIFTEKGYLIVKVLEKNLKTMVDFKKEKDETMKKLIETKKNSFLLSYLQKLMEEYKVKINNYVLETFTKRGNK